MISRPRDGQDLAHEPASRCGGPARLRARRGSASAARGPGRWRGRAASAGRTRGSAAVARGCPRASSSDVAPSTSSTSASKVGRVAPQVARPEQQLLADRPGEQHLARALEDVAEDGRRAARRSRSAVDAPSTTTIRRRVGRMRLHRGAEERRLAGAVRAEDGDRSRAGRARASTPWRTCASPIAARGHRGTRGAAAPARRARWVARSGAVGSASAAAPSAPRPAAASSRRACARTTRTAA